MDKQLKRKSISPGSGSGGFRTPRSINSPLSILSTSGSSSDFYNKPEISVFTTPVDQSHASRTGSDCDRSPVTETKHVNTLARGDSLAKTEWFRSLPKTEKRNRKARFRRFFSTLTPMRARNIQVLSEEDQSNLEWAGWLDYLLFVCSGLVGMGNLVWFPLNLLRYGSVTFFSAYIIIFILVGYPMMLMEAGLGQFCSFGPGGCWEFAKLFQGLGYFMIMWYGSQSVFYITKSMHWLLWQYDMIFYFSWEQPSSSRIYHTLEELFGLNQTKAEHQNVSLTQDTQFYSYILFDLTKAMHLFEAPEDHNVSGLKIYVSYLVTWIMVLIFLIPNIRTRGYIHSRVFVISALCVCVICVRSLALPGAISGIKYGLIYNSRTTLLNYEVWLGAFRQCFYSLALMPGVHMTISSYNHFSNQITKDVFFCGLVDLFFSGVGVIMMFAFLGNIAEMTTIQLDDMYKLSVDDLIFTYLMSILEVGLAWVFFFFTVMILLAHLNLSIIFEVIITGIIDAFTVTTKKRRHVVTCVCSLLFLQYLWLCTEHYVNILRLVEYYIEHNLSTVFGLCLVGPVLYVFGVDRFLSMLECSVGWDATPILSNRWWKLWWKTCWMFAVPSIFVAKAVILIYAQLTKNKEPFESWMLLIVGRTIWLSFPLVIFGNMIYLIATTHEGGFVARLRFLTTPTPNWGPILPQNRYIVEVEEEDRLSSKRIKQKRKTIFEYSQLSWG